MVHIVPPGRLMGVRYGRVVALAGLSLLSYGSPALADTRACITAFDQAQRSVKLSKLKQARSELLVCTDERCPAVLRADCGTVLQQVESALPSVVFAADDGEGHDLTDVRVFVDRTRLADKLDARSMDLDPGAYDFRFERAGQAAVIVHQVVREGEKNRIVRVTFPVARPASPPAPRSEPSPRRSTTGYAVPLGLGGLGLAAVAFGGVSRLAFESDVDDLRSQCAPVCTQDQRADVSSTFVRANVAFGIGLAFFVAAGISWFALAPSTSRGPRSAAAGWTW